MISASIAGTGDDPIIRWTKLNPLVAHLQFSQTAGPFRAGFFPTELRPGALARHINLRLGLQWGLFHGVLDYQKNPLQTSPHSPSLQRIIVADAAGYSLAFGQVMACKISVGRGFTKDCS
jgi:hypothetical protein